MPDVVEGWKETVERDKGVVPSIVLVMVESALPGWVDVWMGGWVAPDTDCLHLFPPRHHAL